MPLISSSYIGIISNPINVSPYVTTSEIIGRIPPAGKLIITTENGINLTTENNIILTTEGE